MFDGMRILRGELRDVASLMSPTNAWRKLSPSTRTVGKSLATCSMRAGKSYATGKASKTSRSSFFFCTPGGRRPVPSWLGPDIGVPPSVAPPGRASVPATAPASDAAKATRRCARARTAPHEPITVRAGARCGAPRHHAQAASRGLPRQAFPGSRDRRHGVPFSTSGAVAGNSRIRPGIRDAAAAGRAEGPLRPSTAPNARTGRRVPGRRVRSCRPPGKA